MANLERVTNNVALLYFEKYRKPTVIDYEVMGYIRWGENNDYGNYLIDLFNGHAEHGAIIRRKAAYLRGKTFNAVDEANQPLIDEFKKKANDKQTWDELNEDLDLSCEIFNGFYLEVITDLVGRPISFKNLDYNLCRLSSCGTTLHYCKDWHNQWKYGVQKIPIYCKGEVGRFFIPFKFEVPVKRYIDGLYATPSYANVIQDVSTDTEIGNFNYNYVANGFSGGTVITFFNGEPDPETKKAIKDKIINNYAGSDNAGEILINFVDKDGKEATVTSINVDDLDKKFEVISKRTQQKILTGHNVTSPELMGITIDGNSLADNRDKLRQAFDLFMNGYVKPRQSARMSFQKKIIELKTGLSIDVEIEQVDPIGLNLMNDPDLTQDERRVLKGYEPLTPIPVGSDGLPVKQAEVNDHLKGLTAAQNMDLMRIVRDFEKGRLNQTIATSRLKAYGFTESEVNDILGIDPNIQKFSSQDILFQLEQSATDDNEDEVLFDEMVHFHSTSEAVAYELSKHKQYFASPFSISIASLSSGILDALKGNPTSTIDDLAKLLGIDTTNIEVAIAKLKDAGLIEPNANGFDPTEKAYNKDTNPIKKTEVYTVYKYALKDGAPPLKAGGSSRPFCQRMMRLSETKHWTYEAINRLSNGMGSNAWDYRGGFYNNPETHQIDPYCRHVWRAITKIKRS